MDRNNPVKIWIIKHNPKREPKFHMAEILAGVGNSITDPEIILVIGLRFFICFIN